MQISSRFTIAVHILICIETFKNDYKVTSDFLASSVNVNPVVVRRLLQQLKKAGIVNVTRGSGGTDLERPAGEITLLENPNPLCPVGKNIHAILDTRLTKIQEAMEREMKSVTIKEVIDDTQKLINNI